MQGCNIDNVNLEILGANMEQYVHPDGNTYYHYYLIVSNNGIATNNSIEFHISGLRSQSPNAWLKVIAIYWDGPRTFLDAHLTVDMQGNSQLFWIPDQNHTAICEVKIYENDQEVFFNPFTWIIPEKIMTGSFPPPQGYQYELYYTDQFFVQHEQGITYSLTFINQVLEALENSWIKEVDEWDLCLGLEPERPKDQDGIYQTFVNDAIYITENIYHGTFETAASGGDDRIIQLGSRLHQYANFELYDPEVDLINSALCHEFYHGIQWSLNESWGCGDWMIEGQARFLQTVFMEEFSNPPLWNEEFLIGRLYYQDANAYLISCLNTSLLDISYPYCLFWRFLYEKYRITGSIPWKLEIIRETCRNNTNPNLVEIENEMDADLTGYGGAFDTMDEAVRAFAKCAYFNDAQYGFWEPQMLQEFYADPPALHLEEDLEIGVSDPPQYILNEHIYNGGIQHVWGIDYMRYDFLQFLELPVGMITFDRDPDDDNAMGDFGIDVFTENMYSHEITASSLMLPPEQEVGEVAFSLGYPYLNRAIVSVVRLDADESSPTADTDYEILISSGVTIDVEPRYSPIIIGQTGGSFHYILKVKNHSSEEDVQCSVWCTVTDPDGGVTTVSEYLVSLQENQEWQQEASYEVQENSEVGTYRLDAYVGKIQAYAIRKWDQDYFSFQVVSIAQPEIAWMENYGGPGNDFGYDALEPNSEYFSAVGTDGFNHTLYLRARSQYGNPYSQHYYGYGTVGYAIEPTSDGNYVICGQTPGGSVSLIKIDFLGGVYWEHSLGSISPWEIGCDVALAQDNGFIISGAAGVSELDLLLMKTSAGGDVIWERAFDTGVSMFEVGRSVCATSDGGYISAGWKTDANPPTGDEVYVVKTDGAGNEDWHLYHSLNEFTEHAHGILQTQDEGYVISGTANDYESGGFGVGNFYIIRTDALGNVMWERVYSDPAAMQQGRGICACSAGGFIMTGTQLVIPYTDGYDVYVLRVDGEGNEIWSLSIDEPTEGSWEMGESIRQISDGGYVIAGGIKTKYTHDWDLLLVRLESESMVNLCFGIPPEYEIVAMPNKYCFDGPFPNPFNARTTIRFQIPTASIVRLSMYDISGRRVAQLVNGWRDAGLHEVSFDGSHLPSGIYFARIEAAGFTQTVKMVLMK